jgi:hypothetical protein
MLLDLYPTNLSYAGQSEIGLTPPGLLIWLLSFYATPAPSRGPLTKI